MALASQGLPTHSGMSGVKTSMHHMHLMDKQKRSSFVSWVSNFRNCVHAIQHLIIPDASLCRSLPTQLNPFPENPLLQAQENEPGRLVHAALVSQGLEMHSSMSKS